MYQKILFILVGITCLVSYLFWPSHHQLIQKPAPVVQKTNVPVKPAKSVTLTESFVEPIKAMQPLKPVEPIKPIEPVKSEPIKTAPVKIKTSSAIDLKKISFEKLPGWDEADVKKSLLAFQNSCNTLLKQHPSHQVGSQHIHLRAGDWQPACEAALSVQSVTEDSARIFFEKWFNPVELKNKPQGLFTGYYMPQVKGSLTQTKTFNTPIYGLPKNLKLHYTRSQIDNGALEKKAPVLAWINSPIDRLSFEIEGSGVVQLPSGKRMYLNYAGENGSRYTSVGNVLIKKGVMTKHNASKNAIKRYLENHPQKINSILQQNKSFVFFKDQKQPAALGAQGMALTPGYSLAVDKRWIPLGMPLWLSTKKPDMHKDNTQSFQRLMIAQDTGGAIRGLMRGDIYWGTGKTAAFLGEQMKNKGRFWLLLPKYMKFL